MSSLEKGALSVHLIWLTCVQFNRELERGGKQASLQVSHPLKAAMPITFLLTIIYTFMCLHDYLYNLSRSLSSAPPPSCCWLHEYHIGSARQTTTSLSHAGSWTKQASCSGMEKLRKHLLQSFQVQ